MEHLGIISSIILGPVIIMVGWLHLQIKDMRTELKDKIDRDTLDRELHNLSEILEIKGEYINKQFDNISNRLERLTDKIELSLKR